MRTKIPKTVNVLGHVWRIEIVDQKKLVDERSGEAEWPTRIIRISKSSGKGIRWPIFLHELRHAYQFESGLCQVFHRQAEEMDADGFASFITSLQKQGVL